MATEHKVFLCVSVWIKGSLADSAEVQCHTESPSGMFFSAGMGCSASLAEPPLPVTCQPALDTTHQKAAASCGSFLAFRLSVSLCDTWLAVCRADWLLHHLSFQICQKTCLVSCLLWTPIMKFRPAHRAAFSIPAFSKQTVLTKTSQQCYFAPRQTVSTLWLIQSLLHHPRVALWRSPVWVQGSYLYVLFHSIHN